MCLAPAPAVPGGLANRAGLELGAVGARVVGGAAVGAHVGRHDAAFHDAALPHLLMSLCHSPTDWPVGVNPSAGGPGNSIAQRMFPNGGRTPSPSPRDFADLSPTQFPLPNTHVF